MFRKVNNQSNHYGGSFRSVHAVEYPDDNGVVRIVYENLDDSDVSAQQLPKNVTQSSIIDSGQIIEPSSIKVLNPTDPNTIESNGLEYASSVAMSLADAKEKNKLNVDNSLNDK